jgi:MFS transporter, ACS family, hexuronate transporter
MPSSFSLRWVAVGVFVVSSTLNYLDRTLLNTLAPLIMLEFHLNMAGFGALLSAFSFAYAASTLAAGWMLDRFGIDRGISAAVGWWSAAAASTGLAGNMTGLTICRIALGIGESAGIPATGKVNGIYLKPEERALGAAVNQIGLSLSAPLAALSIGIATSHSWRLPFVISGLVGFLWIPLWLAVSRRIPPQYPVTVRPSSRSGLALLRERNLLLLVVANVLWMGAYSLWSNWTTLYLTHVHHLSLEATARYVWIPPLISNLGGFFGGWLSLRWMKKLMEPVAARRRAVWVSVAGSLLTLLLPFATGAGWATALISSSFFFALAGSVNIYALPIDIYGAGRSGVAIAALTCAFALLQTVLSPLIGYLADHHLYTQVLWLVTLPLIASAFVLQGLKTSEGEETTTT